MKREHRDGFIIGMYLLLYGVVRFAVEFVRMHDASNPLGGPFTLEQWLALAICLGGVWLMLPRAASRREALAN